MLSAATLLAIYATVGRLLGVHWPIPWTGGGNLTLTAELAVAGFFASVGGGIAFGSPLFVLTALPCWLIGYISQGRANRKFHREEESLRKRNAEQHLGIFEADPPQRLDPLGTGAVDVYDCGACLYLGRVGTAEIEVLIDATKNMPDQGPNDIFIIPESLESPIACPAGPELRPLLNKYFESRDYVVLRWIPAADSANNS